MQRAKPMVMIIREYLWLLGFQRSGWGYTWSPSRVGWESGWVGGYLWLLSNLVGMASSFLDFYCLRPPGVLLKIVPQPTCGRSTSPILWSVPLWGRWSGRRRIVSPDPFENVEISEDGGNSLFLGKCRRWDPFLEEDLLRQSWRQQIGRERPKPKQIIGIDLLFKIHPHHVQADETRILNSKVH